MTQSTTHGGLPEGVTRWQFFGLIQKARRQLGLSKGAVAYLKVAIGCTQDDDFKAGRICAFWTSVTNIASRAEIDRRQVARIEADLIKRAFLEKSASDYSRRGGSRKKGAIGHEFGINLAPLINRAAEIQAAAQKAMFEADESERLRAMIRKLFGDIRRLQIERACDAAAEVLPNKRPSTIQSFERLKQVAEALEAVWEDFSTEAGRGEKSHQYDISPPLNTDRENRYKTCMAKKPRSSQPKHTSPAQFFLLAGISLKETIWQYAQGIEPGKLPSWRSIEMAARDRAMNVGISAKAWQTQCNLLGVHRAALCLMIADRNSERDGKYKVHNASGAFIRMVQKEAQQGAIVDALLSELIAFSKGVANE